MKRLVLLSAVFLSLTTLTTSAQVRLVYALPYYFGDASTTFLDRTYFNVHVDNIGTASDREVYIHYNDGTAAWADQTLGLYKNSGDHSTYTGSLEQSSVEFVVGYDTSEGTFWDNNDGANYNVDPATDVGVIGGNVAMIGATRNSCIMLRPLFGAGATRTNTITVEGDILVQNLGYDKNVGVLVTADNWNTYSNFTASYDTTLSFYSITWDAELWTFSGTLTGTNCPNVYFAVYYEDITGGGTYYWDNNFTNDYKMGPLLYRTIY